MKHDIETVRTIVILMLLAAALAALVWTMATVSADQPIGMEATPRPTLTPPVITPEAYPPPPAPYPAPDAYPVYLPRIDRAALEGYP